MDYKTVHFTKPSQMADALADLMLRHIAAASGSNSAVMLTGGNSIQPVYRRFAAQAVQLDTLDICLIGSDERHVPRSDSASNYLTVLPVVQSLNLLPEKILMPNPALPLKEAAWQYHLDLADFFKRGGKIPFGILSLGADGHVASLFSREDAERGSEVYAIEIERPAPPHRISVTAAFLARVELILLLAAGNEKQIALTKFLNGSSGSIALHALAEAREVIVWTTPTA